MRKVALASSKLASVVREKWHVCATSSNPRLDSSPTLAQRTKPISLVWRRNVRKNCNYLRIAKRLSIAPTMNSSEQHSTKWTLLVSASRGLSKSKQRNIASPPTYFRTARRFRFNAQRLQQTVLIFSVRTKRNTSFSSLSQTKPPSKMPFTRQLLLCN